MTDLFDIEGKTAVVTGGNRGIGRMIAAGLAAAGVHVILVARDAAAGEAAKSSLGDRTAFIQGDLHHEAGVEAIAKEVAALTDHLSILVNNAGIVSRAPLAHTGSQEWDGVVDTNLKAPFYLVRELLPLLRSGATEGDPARVINIGSIEGLRVSGLPLFAYAASKAGLHHLTRLLAHDLGPSNITVNAIAPGTFPTEMSEPSIARRRDALLSETALKRFGRPNDIVGTVQFLCSRAGSFLTGTVIPLDGGASSATSGGY